MFRPPDVSVDEHTGDVASPVAAGPPQTLFHKIRVIFERRQNFSFFVVLIADFLVMGDEPARHEIIVIGIQLIATEPFFVRECVPEGGVFDDAASIGNGPSGQTGETSVHVHARGTVKVPPLEVKSIQIAVKTLLYRRAFRSPQSLIRPYSTIGIVLQRSKHPREKLRGPQNIIVRENRYVCLNFGDGTNHLPPFIGVGDASDFDFGGVHALDHCLGLFEVRIDGNEQDLEWLRG